MQISLLVQGDPVSTPSCALALRFASAAVSAGHAIRRVFFYKDAVAIGNRYIDVPQDETDVQAQWQDFARETSTELTLCVAAGTRRGIIDTPTGSSIAPGFEIVGLGQMVESMLESDRTVTF